MNSNEAKRILIWGMTENIGGIETVIMEIYRNIDRERIQFDFLCDHNSPPIAFEDEIKELGGRIYRIMYSERESFLKARSCLKIFFKQHPEISAVHVHANFPYAFPLKYAKKAGIDLRIIHSHNSFGIEKKRNGIRKLIDYIRKKQIEHQINKYPSLYFACSDLAAKYMFKNRDYIWIKNGINIESFKYSEETRDIYRKELGIEQDATVIGFIGRYREQKNPLYLLEIFKEYLNIDDKAILLMVGIGYMQKVIDEKIEELKLKNNVIQLGKREDIINIYQVFDAFLLPSINEGLPVVLVEAQTAGLECFISDTITQQVDITDLIHYCSISKEPKEWAKLMNENLKKKKDRLKYASEVMHQGFDMKDVVKELEKIYLSE